jgi:hypothetical protein
MRALAGDRREAATAQIGGSARAYEFPGRSHTVRPGPPTCQIPIADYSVRHVRLPVLALNADRPFMSAFGCCSLMTCAGVAAVPGSGVAWRGATGCQLSAPAAAQPAGQAGLRATIGSRGVWGGHRR